jgi:serine/threonine-protein kinase
LTGNEPPSAQDVFLNPDALVSPRQVNPDVSPAVEGAILAAMGPHPGDRPPTVDAWRRLLRTGPLPAQEAAASPDQRAVWAQVWRESGWLIVLAVLLTALVVYLTLR